MDYIFIFNGLPDRAWVIDEVEKQIKALGLEYPTYVTTDAGDATRYVNMYCDMNPDEEVCFVACGGAGLTNEVVSGIVNKENKYLAILSYGGTNDFTKVYPDRNFQSVKAMLKGKAIKVDVLKAKDNYAINTINIGLDAMVTAYGLEYIAAGMKNSYKRAIGDAVLMHRRNYVTIKADGETLIKRCFMDAQFGNGKYCGGEYLCSPNAVPDDGLIELSIEKTTGLVGLSKIMKEFKVGKHLTDPFCKHFVIYRRVRHIELRAKDLFYLAMDGEVIADVSVDIDILDKAVNFILPKK